MDYLPRSLEPNADIDSLRRHLEQELNTIAQVLHEQDVVFLRVLYVEPLKPREGWLVFADGTEWDPGAGRGVYVYTGGAWSKL